MVKAGYCNRIIFVLPEVVRHAGVAFHVSDAPVRVFTIVALELLSVPPCVGNLIAKYLSVEDEALVDVTTVLTPGLSDDELTTYVIVTPEGTVITGGSAIPAKVLDIEVICPVIVRAGSVIV